MLVKDKRRFTMEDAVGTVNRGVLNPDLDERSRQILYEYRNDTGLAKQGLGLQFTPDAPEVWLNPQKIKLNLGSYRDFSAPRWINVAGPRDPKREFNMPLDRLQLKESSVDFIYAPFLIETMPSPLQAARYWRDALKVGGVLAAVINDRDKLIAQGRPFGHTRLGGRDLMRMLEDAGFEYPKMEPINFRRFSLAGNDPGHLGYFAIR